MIEVSIRDMVADDLPRLHWAGTSTHLDYLAKALARSQQGEVALYVVELESQLIAHGAVDFAVVEDAAKFWMLAVREEFQSRGVGTQLMAALEQRCQQSGVAVGVLSVEKINERAKVLYERLGWESSGEITESWTEEAADGSNFTYSTQCWVMTKEL